MHQARALLLQPPRHAWGVYIKHLERSPRLTKSATSLCAAFLGDALAQHFSNIDKHGWSYDYARTARLAIFNAGMGVVGHEYYKVLDGRVMPHASTSPRAVMAKITIDQFMFAPVCTSVFYLFKVLTEGRPSEYVSEMEQKLVPTLLAGYKLWIPAHIINFSLVPNRQRILYANVVSIFGTYILSRAQAGDFSRPAAGAPAQGRRPHHGATEVICDGVVVHDD